MGDKPTFSFIVPFWASHGFLMRCLCSIEASVSGSYEIILVDDGNEGFDFTEAAAQPHVKILHMNENRGPGFCRNRGVEAANGDYIQFIDSDDELISDPMCYFAALPPSIDCLGSLPDIILGSLEGQVFAGKSTSKIGRLTNLKKDHSLVKTTSFTAHLYRRDFLKFNSVVFPTDILTAEDTVFLMRAMAAASLIVVTEVEVYRYRMVEDSLSRSADLQFEARFGKAAIYIADALVEFPLAQAVKLSTIFKYAVKMAQKILVSRPEDFTGTVPVLAAIVERGGLLSVTSVKARESAPVYWNDQWTQAAMLAFEREHVSLAEFLNDTALVVFKGDAPSIL